MTESDLAAKARRAAEWDGVIGMNESIQNKDAQASAAKFFDANNGRCKWPETINGVPIEIVLIKEAQRGQRIIGMLFTPDAKYPGDMYPVCKHISPICDDPGIEGYAKVIGDIADNLRETASCVLTAKRDEQ